MSRATVLRAAGFGLAASLLALAGCDKIGAQIQAAREAVTQGRPPQAFLDATLLQPAVLGDDLMATDLTVGQIADYYGSTGTWRKINATTYILDVAQTDDMTHKPFKLSLEFMPGAPTAGRCDDCAPNEPFVQIDREVLNGAEMANSDISDLEDTIFKANVPVSPTALAAQHKRAAAVERVNPYAVQTPAPASPPPPPPPGDGSGAPPADGSSGAPIADNASADAPASAAPRPALDQPNPP